MLVVMKRDATEAQIEHVVKVIEEHGFVARPIPGDEPVPMFCEVGPSSQELPHILFRVSARRD